MWTPIVIMVIAFILTVAILSIYESVKQINKCFEYNKEDEQTQTTNGKMIVKYHTTQNNQNS